jgi:hypothetical protein
MLAQAKDKRQKTHPNSTGEQEGQQAGTVLVEFQIYHSVT